MKNPPPWWLRLPIYLDWIQLSLVIIVPLVYFAHGRGRGLFAQSMVLMFAAVVLIALDTIGGLGHQWALLPRAGLAFPAIAWCSQEISWHRMELEDWVLLAIAIQQLWVLIACLAADLRLRLRPRSWAG